MYMLQMSLIVTMRKQPMTTNTVLSKRSDVAKTMADRYIKQCHQSVKTTIRSICQEYNYKELGYGSVNSLISRVSEVLVESGFNKHQYLLHLVHEAFNILHDSCSSQSELIKAIKKHLSQHRLKHTHVRDLLQEIGKKSVETSEDVELEKFKAIVRQGFTFHFACSRVHLGYNKLTQAKYWFTHDYKGDSREAFGQYKKQHYYISPKDIINEDKDEHFIKAIWTVIGIIFADGCVYRTSIHLTLTESDGYYLRDYVVPKIMDDSVKGNVPLSMIKQVSRNHLKSYPHSKPIYKLVIEDRMFASYLNELGMQHNKIENPVILNSKILDLPDKYFFCFVAGLFDGDGCITRGSIYQAHIDLALDGQTFCNQLKEQVLLRTGIRLKEYCYAKPNGRLTCKLQSSTNWDAFAFAGYILFFAPFHLKRKVRQADRLFKEVVTNSTKYRRLDLFPGELTSDKASEATLERFLNSINPNQPL